MDRETLVLGIFCLLVLVWTLVSGSAGTDPKNFWREDWPQAFWAIVAAMALVTVGVFIKAFHP